VCGGEFENIDMPTHRCGPMMPLTPNASASRAHSRPAGGSRTQSQPQRSLTESPSSTDTEDEAEDRAAKERAVVYGTLWKKSPPPAATSGSRKRRGPSAPATPVRNEKKTKVSPSATTKPQASEVEVIEDPDVTPVPPKVRGTARRGGKTGNSDTRAQTQTRLSTLRGFKSTTTASAVATESTGTTSSLVPQVVDADLIISEDEGVSRSPPTLRDLRDLTTPSTARRPQPRRPGTGQPRPVTPLPLEER
jgi:hypothetical protein